MVCLIFTMIVTFQVMSGEEETRRRRRKKINKIEIFVFVFLTLLKVSRTFRIDLSSK